VPISWILSIPVIVFLRVFRASGDKPSRAKKIFSSYLYVIDVADPEPDALGSGGLGSDPCPKNIKIDLFDPFCAKKLYEYLKIK
jgi:hypothetical protein